MHEPGWHATVRFDELGDGQLREVSIQHEPILLVRVGSEVFASSAVCPHKFGLLVEGTLEGRVLQCPVHVARFDLQSGQPGIGQQWAGVLPVFPVRVREGVVEVQLPAPH